MRALVCASGLMLAATAAAAGTSCDLPDEVAFRHPSERQIGLGFGQQFHPLLGRVQLHPGIDYPGPIRDPVVAAAAGRVLVAEHTGAPGNQIVVDHGGGWRTSYSHLSRFSVTAGTCIKAGDTIGQSGSTGLSSEPHLHFEISRDGTPLDPIPMLPRR
jgi:murein DD-endopeptidase MepM/ murein hydrolase activator NlpD